VSRALVPLISSIALHLGIAAILAGLSVRRAPAAQESLQVSVVDVPQETPEPLPPPPPPKPVPLKLARAPKTPTPPPMRTPLPQPVDEPPPPTHEANSPAPVVVTGITMESTSEGGSFAVGAGNTLRGAPERTKREPEAIKPYKADKYAPAAQVTELPRPLNGGSVNLRKYYPPQALKEGFEGDVVLRLLIDADGSVAKVDIVNDPGSGLGPAAAKMVKAEYRFSPATVNGVPVATTVPFTVHFTLN
jgi:protein TonB